MGAKGGSLWKQLTFKLSDERSNLLLKYFVMILLIQIVCKAYLIFVGWLEFYSLPYHFQSESETIKGSIIFVVDCEA